MHTCYAQVVLHHLHLHNVLARAGVSHRSKGIHDEFGIQFHITLYLRPTPSPSPYGGSRKVGER